MNRKSTGLMVWILVAFFSVGVTAEESNPSLPTEYTLGSKYTIRYDDLDLILSSTVLEVGLSDRRSASRTDKRNVTTRIRHSNMSSTSFEGNRVTFDVFDSERQESLLEVRKDLEAVPDFIPLEQFSKNEQLAYWLNLHNVAVMYEVVSAYPIKKIKSLAKGRKSIWNTKTMSVAGVPISIQDIEDHVVQNWNDPLVLYGFFMGTVGGPNIRSEAYTADNVVDALKENAADFVNSLRGFRLWSGYGKISGHYEIGAKYFPDFDEDIKSHLLKFANNSTARQLVKADRFRTNNYDWGIADVKDGAVYHGSSFNTSAASLWAFIEIPDPNGSGQTGHVPGVVTVGNDVGLTGPRFQNINPQAMALFRGIKKRNERRMRRGEVTVEEYVGGEGSRVTRSGSDDRPEPSPPSSGGDGDYPVAVL